MHLFVRHLDVVYHGKIAYACLEMGNLQEVQRLSFFCVLTKQSQCLIEQQVRFKILLRSVHFVNIPSVVGSPELRKRRLVLYLHSSCTKYPQPTEQNTINAAT